MTILDQEAQRDIDIESKEYIKILPRIKDETTVVVGRTERWMASTWNKQELILLPFNHRFSYLVAVAEDHLCGHLGVSSTIARIRSKYWIIHIRILVKQIVSKCIVYCKRRKTFWSQSMGQLPIERIQPSPPFSFTVIDFFGPYSIRGEFKSAFEENVMVSFLYAWFLEQLCRC